MISETQIIKRVVNQLKKVGRRSHPKRNYGLIGLHAVHQIVEDAGDSLYHQWFHPETHILGRKLNKKIMKKLRQPFRKNLNRKRLRAKSAGKNNVTRRG